MASTRARRENQFFDVGKEGRKTGLTVAEKPKDKYGLESIDDVFSSPHKAASRTARDHVSPSSKSMDLSRGSAVDPTVILTERRVLKSTNSHFPPPSSKSPRKTNLGSSPRRQSSVGPSAGPRRSSLGPPIRPSSVRKLNFAQAGLSHPSKLHTSVSPLQEDLRQGMREPSAGNQYDLEFSPDPEESVEDAERMEDIEEANEDVQLAEESVAMLRDGYDTYPEEFVSMNGGTDVREEHEIIEEQLTARDFDEDELIMAMPHDDADLDDAEEPISSPMAQKKKRVQPKVKRRRTQDQVPANDSSSIDPSLLEETQAPLRKRGRPRKSDITALADTETIRTTTKESKRKATQKPAKGKKKASASTLAASTAVKKRGKRASMASEDHTIVEDAEDQDATDQDAADQSLMPPPAMRPSLEKTQSRKRRATDEASETEEQSSDSAPRKKAKNAQAQPNQMLPPVRRPGPRGLHILRHTTPAEDIGTITRSGRRAIAPLAHWKLEKVDRTYDGTITGVELVEEVQAEARTKKRGTKAKATKRELVDLQEDEDDDLEDWEAEGETIIGSVQQWEAETGTSSYEMIESEIAYGRMSIVPKDVHGANFQYARVVSTDFFGTGLMSLPVGGFKARKNARKMVMCFYVAEGKLEVDVGITQFTISKGGTWQVPRGNTYSLKNVGTKPAKLFFAQANEKLYIDDGE